MDDEYMDRVLAGDTKAYRHFLTNYKDMAFNIAVSIVKDDHYAEEIVQDAFMQAFSGLKSFKRTTSFKNWFYRIIVNESFQRLRKLKKNRFIQPVAEVKDSVVDSTQEGQSEKIALVLHAIQALPANESLALTLFYQQENSLKEIVEITGWSMANTKVILHRARKSIRTHLGID
ncbi:RNA polymerase sigma factor [Tunicatimonas pelagia]|uniref:RNA polymerase sigma factor n=1 Tax=Tunicatimonas pelagia TaxID=931531 RepID=UPI002666999D|nr:RNA polymerase sigma factor [Tunicatimonas pelagia]WKN43889.1 RNA polymerase sigma factor [Tunicatimonas pelagia]